MNQRSMQQFLAGTALCRDLPPEALALLTKDAELVELRNGELLIEQGQVGDCLFFVIDGCLEAQLQTDDAVPRILPLGRIGAGEPVGELAVLSNEPRVCSVVAIRESRVIKIWRDACLALVTTYPQAWFRITQHIVRRTQGESHRAPVISHIALIPTGRSVHLHAFARSLVAALCEYGPACLTREQDLAAPTGSDSIVANLASLVQGSERVVHLGESRGTHWTRRTVRQADLILVVASLDEEPELSDFERSALFSPRPMSTARIELVLLRPDRAVPPRGTERWLRNRKVHRHHHIALNEPADLQRLARLITGNAVNLVLSGGGARGFAHIGVLRALTEAGIPIDQIGGTSMGAGIAAYHSMGFSVERMLEGIRSHLGAVRDVTLPLLSIFTGRGWTRALQSLCRDIRIEDLPIPYFAVSADLRQAVEYIHRSGPLWLAVRASTSLPGLYPPVLLEEDACLVDGGVLNNFPVDVMAALGGGRIVGVDVSQEFALTFTRRHEVDVSGWRLLWQRINPFRRMRHEPNLADLLVRSAEVASVRITRISQENTPIALRVVPPVSHFRTLDFDSLDAIVEAGYRHAIERVAEWRQILLSRSTRSLRERLRSASLMSRTP
jgi:predicted acylesterase/phospholipase RssA/CRP-like cAMP-binding protein